MVVRRGTGRQELYDVEELLRAGYAVEELCGAGFVVEDKRGC